MSFKVKISDGSTVGPLDMQMLHSWYQQGLIDADTPVLAPSSRQWGRLRDVLNIAGGSSKRAAVSVEGEDWDAEDAESSTPGTARGGPLTAGGLLIIAAGAAVAARLIPGVWRADLGPMPWTELGWVLLFLGLTSVHGAEWARKLARFGVGLAGFALFPVAGLLIARGVPLDALFVLISAWAAASGLFFLLAPMLPWTRLAAAALVVLAGAYGVVRFGLAVGEATAAAPQSSWFASLLK